MPIGRLRNVRAVVFDLDGTLVDSLGIWADVDRDFLSRRGLAVPNDLAHAIEGMSLPEAGAYFRARFGLAEPAEAICAEWTAMVAAHYRRDVPPMEGADDILEDLARHGIPLALGSSNQRSLALPLLERLGWISLFAHVLFSDEVDAGKPSPALFLELARRMAVSPAETVVVEDSPAGVLAARAAGMASIAVRRRDDATGWDRIRNLATASVDSLLDLLPVSAWL